jgi:hypothetical protein
MRKIAILGAAAVLATAMAGPAMAREMAKDMRGTHHRHMAARSMHGHMARGMQQQADAGWNNNGWDRGPTGFFPADVAAGAVGAAAGVAGAAIGTAGAIATAPFRGADSYAYAPGQTAYNTYDYGPNGYYGDWNSYATRNGIVCRPGTWFKDGDRRRMCQ